MDSLKCLTSTHLLTLFSLYSSTLNPIFISMGDLASVNGIHQWPVIRWWTTMFDLDTSIHTVGHDLVAVCVEYFLYWWHLLYATSLIMPVFMRFHLLWRDSSICQIFPATMEILIYFISSAILEIMVLLYIFIMEILIYVYCTWRWPHMWFHVLCLFMAIVLLCIRDYYMYLKLYVELYYCTMLIGWLVFHLGSFITPLLGWTYNVFRPSYDPSDLTH